MLLLVDILWLETVEQVCVVYPGGPFWCLDALILVFYYNGYFHSMH